MSKVYISETKCTGMGLFAKSDINKDEIILVFKGKVVRDRYDSDYRVGPNWISLGKETWLDLSKGHKSNFINHSCNPNAGFRGKVTVVAMKPIKKDEEVTIDYSITEEDPYWKMKCRCGSRNCRKTIRGVGFLPLRLFKKYKNYIPAYLQKSYLRGVKTKERR